MSTPRLIAVTLLASLAAGQALAWDAGPWDPAPFGQPTSRSAEARAQIAAARAGQLVQNRNVQGTRIRAREVTVTGTRSGQSCIGNVGSVAPPSTLRGGNFTAITDVRVGTVNVLC